MEARPVSDAAAETEAHARLVDRLRDQAADVRRLTAGLGEEALSKRTIPEKWSLKELVCHVLRVQRLFEARLDRLLAEDNPEFVSYGPQGDDVFEAMAKRPAAETLRDFATERERLVARLESLSGVEWRRAGRHPEYRDYDVCVQMTYMAHHEAHHIYQMLQRRAPFGPIPHES